MIRPTTRPSPFSNELASVTDGWRLIERRPEQQTGLATAVIEGMEVARGDAVCVMDADFQHPPALVPQLLAIVEDGTDLAIASRYGRGGRNDGLAGVYRHLISVCWRTCSLAESQRTTDPLSGCFCTRRSALAGRDLRPVGFKLLLELLVLCPELRVLDIPFAFGRRPAGKSKPTPGKGCSIWCTSARSSCVFPNARCA
jgi:dolichol-phosphate mannosyltransferase